MHEEQKITVLEEMRVLPWLQSITGLEPRELVKEIDNNFSGLMDRLIAKEGRHIRGSIHATY
jgi:hypothetical protein